MLRLSLKNDARWLELPYGVKVEVRPLTTALVNAARAEALKRLAMQQVEAEAAAKAGQPLDSTAFNASNPSALDGLFRQYQIEALARYGITRWEGVSDQAGQPLPVDAASVEAFAAHPEMSSAFDAAYAVDTTALAAEGNGSAPTSDGSSAPGESTATDAEPAQEPTTETAEAEPVEPEATTAAEPAPEPSTSPSRRKAQPS